jgi:hypothetical protein
MSEVFEEIKTGSEHRKKKKLSTAPTCNAKIFPSTTALWKKHITCMFALVTSAGLTWVHGLPSMRYLTKTAITM